LVTGLPPTFRRLVHGDELKLGGRRFLVLTGDGHAPEQVMLFCAEELISGFWRLIKFLRRYRPMSGYGRWSRTVIRFSCISASEIVLAAEQGRLAALDS
jgi:hypothetical protein